MAPTGLCVLEKTFCSNEVGHIYVGSQSGSIYPSQGKELWPVKQKNLCETEEFLWNCVVGKSHKHWPGGFQGVASCSILTSVQERCYANMTFCLIF